MLPKLHLVVFPVDLTDPMLVRTSPSKPLGQPFPRKKQRWDAHLTMPRNRLVRRHPEEKGRR
eukprot:7255897-Pyramimonas_sp.AAC.1